MQIRGSSRRDHRRQNGQAITELGVSLVVFLLLLTGLLDLGRVYYFTSALRGTAFAAARHAAWFSNNQRQNPYLDDSDITTAVNEGLAGANLATVTGVQGTCPNPSDSNSYHNPPYDNSLYPTGINQTYLYVCYTTPGGTVTGSQATAPGPYISTWHLGDVNVILLFNYGLVTGFLQNQLQAVGGIKVAANAHFTIQGGP
ncbi:MAG TPA: TadE/TadG family type IV pilus assembly protein [Candidatus Dormibacteraeota bacterium]